MADKRLYFVVRDEVMVQNPCKNLNGGLKFLRNHLIGANPEYFFNFFDLSCPDNNMHRFG